MLIVQKYPKRQAPWGTEQDCGLVTCANEPEVCTSFAVNYKPGGSLAAAFSVRSQSRAARLGMALSLCRINTSIIELEILHKSGTHYPQMKPKLVPWLFVAVLLAGVAGLYILNRKQAAELSQRREDSQQ